jgi:hypothetical protein
MNHPFIIANIYSYKNFLGREIFENDISLKVSHILF